MIGIQLDGDDEFLETQTNISISVRLENPILSDDDRISPGSFSYPFNLPGGEKSPSNASKLKNPDVIENNEAYTIQKATLFASSDPNSNVIPFKKGNLKSTDSDKDRINSYFTFGLNSISQEFKTAKLRDVLNEQFNISSSSITKKIYVKRTTGADWNLTINGKTYTSPSLNNLVIAINLDADAALDTGKYMPLATEVAVGSTPSGLIVNDYLELKLSLYYTYYDTVLMMDFWLRSDAIDPLLELSVTSDTTDYLVETNMGTYFSEYDTFLADYISGTYPNDKVRFPVCLNANPYGELLKDGELVNGVNTAGFIKNDPNWGLYNSKPFQVKNYNSILPFLRRKWILDKIATTFGFTWEGDFYYHPDVENMLEWNSASLDFPLPFIGEKNFVFWKRSFNLNELIPDITVVEYLRRLKSRYNLATYYNEITQRVSLSFREPIAKSKVYEDITPLCSPVIGNKDLRVTGYRLICQKESEDAFSEDESVVIGTPEEDIPIDCGRLFQQSADVVDGKALLCPRVSQLWGEGDQLRTFYYKGLIDVTTFQYPGADIHGDLIYEKLADFVLISGLYSTFWKYWLHAQKNRRSVKLEVDFPLRSLVRFDWSLKRRFNRFNYMVKSIDVTITNQSVKVDEVELYTTL